QIDRSPIGVDGFYFRERYGHGVDGEVPAGEVDLDVVGELDAGLAGIVAVDLLAEGGHFNPVPVLDGADRAEGLPDGIDRASPTGEEPLDVIGPGIGGEIEIDLLPTVQEGIAHRPSDQVYLIAGGAEQLP